jgi:hypothetical protein
MEVFSGNGNLYLNQVDIYKVFLIKQTMSKRLDDF